MSVEDVGWALHQQLESQRAKLILIGICNHDGDGGSWPSIATLARYAACSPRTVKRLLKELEDDGWITIHRNEGGTRNTRADKRTNLYVVNYERGDRADTSRAARGDKPAPRGDTVDTPRGDTAMSPELPIEPSKKNPARERADAMVKAWWEWHQREHSAPPTAQPYIAVVKVVEKLVKTGRWTDAQIKTALRDAPTVSVGAMELVLNRMKPAEQPPAPQQAAKHEPTVWRPDDA